ncbi:hypothetical protein C0992_001707 [Termitomyces sp. T32_za158]|nr:hypothetical protein C0992_001707 [Termitomyces sp. T32_za158]
MLSEVFGGILYTFSHREVELLHLSRVLIQVPPPSPSTVPTRSRKWPTTTATGNHEHPELVYRSDALTTPFAKPFGRFPALSVKSVRGVFDTPLNKVWDTVGPQIRDIIKARTIQWTSIDPARFFTHGPVGEEEKGRLGPVVIWIGVLPGSTSPNIAHGVSQRILALLRKNAVDDVVVEWREAVLQMLAGPPLLRPVLSIYPTHHVRRFLTPLLAVPLATESMEEEDSQGTLTLWFHEIKDHEGKPSNKVYGVSNCHVLRKDTTVDYDLKRGLGGRVRVCGLHRFQQGLDEIMDAIDKNVLLADLRTREITTLQAQEPQNAREIQLHEQQLEEANYAIANLEKFLNEVTKNWSSIKRQRNIGRVVYAPAITVDKGHTEYTSDWGVFLADEAIVKDAFEGNAVDLGAN